MKRVAPARGGLTLVVLAVLPLLARGDELRNVKPGEPLPPFECEGLDGQRVSGSDVAGKAFVLVYVGAGQQQSEKASAAARQVVKAIDDPGLRLVYMSAHVERADELRQLRDRLNLAEPFALDKGREYYGELGLIVLPTTVVASSDGKLLHVLAGWRRDYEHRLDSYCRHALGQVDDAELAELLTARPRVKDEAREKSDQYRKLAATLRAKGRHDAAVRTLEQAVAADPGYADALLDLADALAVVGKLDQAEQRLSELQAEETGHPRTKLIAGLIALRREQLDEAEALLKEALLRKPDRVRAHYYLGQLYEKRGDYKAATEQYREALRRLLAER